MNQPATATAQGAQSVRRDMGEEMAAWNKLYRSEPDEVTGYPNRFLAEVVQGVRSGAAIDIGMGQGRNSLFLARLGWKVTGIDLSDAGIEISRKAASKQGLNINAVVADFSQFDLGKQQWDLVVGVYMGGMITTPAARIAASLRAGGNLVVENFHIDIHQKGLTGDPIGYRVNQLLNAYLPSLRIVRYEEVLDFPDWSNEGLRVPLVRMLAREDRT